VIIDGLVKQDKCYLESALLLNEMEMYHGILKIMAKGFEHRREMLINVGAIFRKEMDTDISTSVEKDKFKKDMG